MAIDDSGLVFLTKAKQLPKPTWFIDNLLVEGGVAMFSGQPKIGKSGWAAHLTYAVATGTDFFGKQISHGGPVLYLAGERATQTEDRLLSLFGDDEPHNVVVYAPTLSSLGVVRFNKLEQVKALHKLLQSKALHPRLIVVDTLSNFIEGSDSADDVMGPFFDGVRWLCDQFNAAAVVIHHDTKEYVDWRGKRTGGSSFRGSGAGLGRVDAHITAKQVGQVHDVDEASGELKPVKVTQFELETDNWGGFFRTVQEVRETLTDHEHRNESQMTANEVRAEAIYTIMSELDRPVISNQALMDHCRSRGIEITSPTMMANAMKLLVNQGRVTKVKGERGNESAWERVESEAA